MDTLCPRCAKPATPAGHEDARAIYRCEFCNRIWMTHLVMASAERADGSAPTRVLVVATPINSSSFIALKETGVSRRDGGVRIAAIAAAAATPPTSCCSV
jgi:hypothetical protein